MNRSGRPDAGRTGAVASTRRRRPWWLWTLLTLVALAVLAVLVSGLVRGGVARGVGADPATGPTASGVAPAAVPAPGAAALDAPAADDQGSLITEDTALLPVARIAGPNGELTGQAGKAVMARGVAVQSVPVDGGFWIGTSDTNRIWVQLTGEGEPAFRVAPGDRIDFTGDVTTQSSDFAQRVGVDAAAGAEQLTRQGGHIQVPGSALVRSTG